MSADAVLEKHNTLSDKDEGSTQMDTSPKVAHTAIENFIVRISHHLKILKREVSLLKEVELKQ